MEGHTPGSAAMSNQGMNTLARFHFRDVDVVVHVCGSHQGSRDAEGRTTIRTRRAQQNRLRLASSQQGPLAPNPAHIAPHSKDKRLLYHQWPEGFLWPDFKAHASESSSDLQAQT